MESGVLVDVTLPCGTGSHPVKMRLTFWGELEVVENPCDLLGSLGRMTDQRCKQETALLVEAWKQNCAPYMETILVQGKLPTTSVSALRALSEALLNALDTAREYAQEILQQPLDPQKLASEWAIAAGGMDAQIDDWRRQVPLTQWHRISQLWLLRRALQGERAIWKWVWEFLLQLYPQLHRSSLSALARGLGGSGSDRAWDYLEPLLTDADASVQLAAIEAVGALREPRARETLLQIARQPTVNEAGPKAVHALGAIGGQDTARQLVDLMFQRPALREACQQALVQIGAEAIPEIGQTLNSHFDPTLREICVQILKEIGDASAIPYLSDALKRDKQWSVRYLAVEAIRAIDPAVAVPALVDGLGDEQEMVRALCVETLIELGDTAVPTLVEAIRDPYWVPERRYIAQWAAVRALGAIGTQAVVEQLLPLLDEMNLNTRWAAAAALRYTRNPNLREHFEQLLLGPAPLEIQYEAARYLYDHATPDSLDALLAGMKQNDKIIPRICREAIVHRIGTDALVRLIEALRRESHGQLRVNLIRTLGEIGHPAAKPDLESLVDDPNPQIQQAAREALQKIEQRQRFQ